MSNKIGYADYGSGFVPDVLIKETAGGFPLKALGDTAEVMLHAALNDLLGKPQAVYSSLAKSRNNSSPLRLITSSIDRTPARRGMYIEMKQGLSDTATE
ncbi:hypothetical protein AGMMS4956_10280 [Bacteroidia bacterium]|nr:hypothetical protein AGMMS4956_10280 [Bacteroidia bacterium]